MRIPLAIAVMIFGLGVAGCDTDNDGFAERTGEKIDNAVKKAGEKIEDATDDAGRALEEAGDEVRENTQ